MTTGLFSFEDVVHNHLSIGDVADCLACAQTRADMALSAAAYHAAREAAQAAPMLTRVPVLVGARVSGNRRNARRSHSRKTGTLSSVA
jgi:hypothetical protein